MFPSTRIFNRILTRNGARPSRGLSKWLVECVMTHPDLWDIGRFVLATRDAHALYRKYADFDALPNPEMWMARTRG